MGTYQLHVIACNLDLSRVGDEVKSAMSPHKLMGIFFQNLSPSLMEVSNLDQDLDFV